MHRAAQRVDNCEKHLDFFTKAMFRPRTRLSELITVIRKPSARSTRKKLGIDHQCGQYYEHCTRLTKPRDLKARLQCQPLPSFSRQDEETLKFWGEDDGPTVCSMGKFIEIGAGALSARKDGQVEGLGGLVQVEGKRRLGKATPVRSRWERNLFKLQQASQTRSTREDAKERRQKVVRRSVQWKPWWRQGNNKCAVSEEYASC